MVTAIVATTLVSATAPAAPTASEVNAAGPPPFVPISQDLTPQEREAVLDALELGTGLSTGDEQTIRGLIVRRLQAAHPDPTALGRDAARARLVEDARAQVRETMSSKARQRLAELRFGSPEQLDELPPEALRPIEEIVAPIAASYLERDLEARIVDPALRLYLGEEPSPIEPGGPDPELGGAAIELSEAQMRRIVEDVLAVLEARGIVPGPRSPDPPPGTGPGEPGLAVSDPKIRDNLPFIARRLELRKGADSLGLADLKALSRTVFAMFKDAPLDEADAAQADRLAELIDRGVKAERIAPLRQTLDSRFTPDQLRALRERLATIRRGAGAPASLDELLGRAEREARSTLGLGPGDPFRPAERAQFEALAEQVWYDPTPPDGGTDDRALVARIKDLLERVHRDLAARVPVLGARRSALLKLLRDELAGTSITEQGRQELEQFIEALLGRAGNGDTDRGRITITTIPVAPVPSVGTGVQPLWITPHHGLFGPFHKHHRPAFFVVAPRF